MLILNQKLALNSHIRLNNWQVWICCRCHADFLLRPCWFPAFEMLPQSLAWTTADCGMHLPCATMWPCRCTSSLSRSQRICVCCVRACVAAAITGFSALSVFGLAGVSPQTHPRPVHELRRKRPRLWPLNHNFVSWKLLDVDSQNEFNSTWLIKEKKKRNSSGFSMEKGRRHFALNILVDMPMRTCTFFYRFLCCWQGIHNLYFYKLYLSISSIKFVEVWMFFWHWTVKCLQNMKCWSISIRSFAPHSCMLCVSSAQWSLCSEVMYNYLGIHVLLTSKYTRYFSHSSVLVVNSSNSWQILKRSNW